MMMIKEAAQALHADWGGKDIAFTGVSTDSRTLKPGNLFIALTGANFDGSQFVGSAVENGAVAVMLNQTATSNELPAGIPFIRVKDTKTGLGQLAAYWRNCFTLPIIGVTGSNGKTTVKEMIASILRRQVANDAMQSNDKLEGVLATEGNLNNEIGVPHMLLRLRQHHRYAVIEMGMNHLGEISYLTHLVRPAVALITNAGTAHIEGLGSVAAVARAKAEIFEGLDQQGVAVINADDAFAPEWFKYAGSRRVVTFGLQNKSIAVTAEYQADTLHGSIMLKLPDGMEEVRLQVPGIHNIYNALAAAAATTALGIEKEVIASGLESFQGVQGRMQKKSGLYHAQIIDDTYNANPASVRAALAVLAAIKGTRILILGDMGELGEAAIALHRAMGIEARKAGLDRLLTLGELSAYAAEEFGPGAQHFKTLDELLNTTKQLLAEHVTVLIKGSRFMQMERVVRGLEV